MADLESAQQPAPPDEFAGETPRTQVPAGRPRTRGVDGRHDGYEFENLSFNADENFIGEVTNYSEKDLEMAPFDLSIYDVDGTLTEVRMISLDNFGDSETRSFETYTEGGLPRGGMYKIDLTNAFEED